MRVIAYTLILIYSIYLQAADNNKNSTFLQIQSQAAETNLDAEEKS
jgi:hypothetical protein